MDGGGGAQKIFQKSGVTWKLQALELWREVGAILGVQKQYLRHYGTRFIPHDEMTPGICAFLT